MIDKVGSLFKFHAIEFDKKMYSRPIDTLLKGQFYAPTLHQMNDIREGLIANFLARVVKENIDSSIDFKFIKEMFLKEYHEESYIINSFEHDLENYRCVDSETSDFYVDVGIDENGFICMPEPTIEQRQIIEEKTMNDISLWLDEKLAVKTSGVYCLSTNNESISHWDRYADNYHGICIEYDYELFTKHISNDLNGKFIAGQISYKKFSEIKSDILERIKDISAKDLFKYMFFVKTSDWEPESEYRFVLPEDKAYSFDPASLKTIFFGKNMHEVYKEFILKEVRRVDAFKHVKFKVFRLDEFGEVQFDEIK